MQRECGSKHWKNFSRTYCQVFSKNQQVPQNIEQKQCQS